MLLQPFHRERNRGSEWASGPGSPKNPRLWCSSLCGKHPMELKQAPVSSRLSQFLKTSLVSAADTKGTEVAHVSTDWRPFPRQSAGGGFQVGEVYSLCGEGDCEGFPWVKGLLQMRARLIGLERNLPSCCLGENPAGLDSRGRNWEKLSGERQGAEELQFGSSSK